MRAYFELGKLRIAVLSTVTSAVGFILASPAVTSSFLFLISGVFLLACGSCALNHYQERDVDALMARTRSRPLPAGKIRPGRALLFSLALIFSGLSLLFPGNGPLTAAIGAFALFWYNGVYTPLKRKTAFAAVPGGLVGVLPPAMGWVAGGGALSDPRFLALALFLFMWQVPHFWLLLLDHEEDYRKAGLPVLTGIFSRRQLARLTSHWTAATAVSALLIPLYGLVSSPAVMAVLVISSFWFGLRGAMLTQGKIPGCAAFKKTGLYLLLVMVILTVERLGK